MNDNPLWDIKFLYSGDPQRARAEYFRHCGRAYNDPRINKELHDLVWHHDFSGDGTIAVPEALMLAILLRPLGEKGKQPPPVPILVKRKRGLVGRYCRGGLG